MAARRFSARGPQMCLQRVQLRLHHVRAFHRCLGGMAMGGEPEKGQHGKRQRQHRLRLPIASLELEDRTDTQLAPTAAAGVVLHTYEGPV